MSRAYDFVLVTKEELFFPLDQDLSRSRLEHICLWKTDVTSLRKKFHCDFEDDGFIHIKLLQVGCICLLSFCGCGYFLL